MCEFNERIAFNAHSPGPVVDDEVLLKYGFNPENITADNILAPSILELKHLGVRSPCEASGSSVNRKKYTTKEQVRAHIDAIKKSGNPQRVSDFVIEFPTKEVRGIRDSEDEQSFLVIDTALADHRSHASIIVAKTYTSAVLRKYRNQLLDVWRTKPRKTVDEVYLDLQGAAAQAQ